MNTRISGSESSENIILRKISWHTIFGMDYSYLQNPQSALAHAHNNLLSRQETLQPFGRC